jgi:hypothetical protein
MSPLLLRTKAATVIQVISPRPIATKGHSNDLSISLTSFTQSGIDPHKYLLTSRLKYMVVVIKGTTN